jgi:transcriptional regulator with XRE-family HTH domain
VDPRAGEQFGYSLDRQLKASGLSRRQLARRSGVDHSTISRLARGQRTPTLDTATKLARVLPELARTWERREDGSGSGPGWNGPARVELALRSDGWLTARDVREVMNRYLTIRSKRVRERPGTSRRASSQLAQGDDVGPRVDPPLLAGPP